MIRKFDKKEELNIDKAEKALRSLVEALRNAERNGFNPEEFNLENEIVSAKIVLDSLKKSKLTGEQNEVVRGNQTSPVLSGPGNEDLPGRKFGSRPLLSGRELM